MLFLRTGLHASIKAKKSEDNILSQQFRMDGGVDTVLCYPNAVNRISISYHAWNTSKSLDAVVGVMT